MQRCRLAAAAVARGTRGLPTPWALSVAGRRAVVLQSAVVVAALLGACRDSGPGVRPTDAAADRTPDRADTPPADVYCAADALGGGPCAYNFCDTTYLLKSVAILATGEIGHSGNDDLCRANGNVCVAVTPAATGDALLLTCVPPTAGALAYGAACARDPGAGQRCANDSLCIEAAAAPGMPFCSGLCRVDRDCPAESYCLDYQSAPLPNGSHALVGMCTPRTKIAGTVCQSEKDCGAGMGCVRYGGHTSLLVCKPGGAKAMGEACASAGECRSGECYDQNFRIPNGANRTYCSGLCAKNSDCGADQSCVRTLHANNGTPDDPLDDIVVGYCQTRFVPLAADGCTTDTHCFAAGTGDSCDVLHGSCYTRLSVIGAACQRNEDCGSGDFCATGPRFRNGACLRSGCTQATSGADACPGANAVCAQRASDAPVSVCYERCTAGGCSRAAEGFACGGGDEPANICLFSSQT